MSADLPRLVVFSDDWGRHPSSSQHLVRELLPPLRTIVAVSEPLRARLASMGYASELLTHGIELRHWARVAARPPRTERAGREKPVAVFWGNADKRLDVEIVLALAAACEL